MELDHWMTNSSFAPDISFFGTLARLRLKAGKYLIHGSAYRSVMVTAHQASNAGVAVSNTGMPVTPICDWGDAFSNGTPRCCNTSNVLATAWTAATTGEIAIAVANHGTTEVAVVLSLQLPTDYMARARHPYLLVATPMRDEQGWEDSTNAVAVEDGHVARLVKSLPGRSANVFELKRY